MKRVTYFFLLVMVFAGSMQLHGQISIQWQGTGSGLHGSLNVSSNNGPKDLRIEAKGVEFFTNNWPIPSYSFSDTRFMSFHPIYVIGNIDATGHIAATGSISATSNISANGNILANGTISSLSGISTPSITTNKLFTSRIDAHNASFTGTVRATALYGGVTMSPAMPAANRDNCSWIGSGLVLLTENPSTDPPSLLNLCNKSGINDPDSWQICFSNSENGTESAYREYVHLKTSKSTAGTVFAIRTLDNSGAGQMITRLTVNEAGNVLIGGSTGYNNERLFVDGIVRAASFKTAAASFPDYVFESGYALRSIEELSTYIQNNKKLPGMPSEQEVMKQGLDLSQVSTATVEKVEELSLYIIQLNARIKALEAKLVEAGK